MDTKTLGILRSNPRDLLILSSWYYKCGEPIIDDHEFNALEREVGALDTVWDEISEPVDLIEKYGLKRVDVSTKVIGDNEYFNEYMDSLFMSDTKSVNPTYEMSDVYSRMLLLSSVTDELCISLKVDGVSSRNIIEKNGAWNLVASLSRSRDSKGFDYTDGMRLSVKRDLTFPDDVGEVHEHSNRKVIFAYGEVYVERGALEYLRKKYNRQDTWKTPRSTALSMLRALVSEEDYKYLKFRCFKLSVGNTLDEMFTIASNAGLNIVPYEVVKTKDIPKDYDKWEAWFNKILAKYRKIQMDEDIEADGIVVAVNNQTEFNSLGESSNAKYNNGMFSCKVGPWGSYIYYSKVVDIKFENVGNTSEYSVVAIVEPVIVSTGNTVTRVNCFNLKILIDNGIKIGSEICFEYKSSSSVVLVYK